MKKNLPKFANDWQYKKTKTKPQRGTIIAEGGHGVYLTCIGKGKGNMPYTVVYGLHNKEYKNYESAITDFSGCILHSIECEG